jgi:hypothetical protein
MRPQSIHTSVITKTKGGGHMNRLLTEALTNPEKRTALELRDVAVNFSESELTPWHG